MIPRKPPRIPFPKRQIENIRADVSAGTISEERAEKSISFLKTRFYNQDRIKEGQADPKLAGAILELAHGEYSENLIDM